MMRLGPIIKREIEIKSRGLTIPMVMTVINAVLFAGAIAAVSAAILRIRTEFALDYAAFLHIYMAVAAMQYIMVLFMVPIFTADTIAGERERGTFDMLLTTRLTAAEIFAEKLASAYVSIAVIIISGLPAMLIPLMFGGVHIQSAVFAMLIILIEAFELMAIGMLTSSFSKTTVQSIALSYALIGVLTAGPLLICGITGMFSEDGGNGFIYLTVIDPLLPLAAVLSEQTGEGTELLREVYGLLNGEPGQLFLKYSAFTGILLQTLISICCIFAAVIHIMPHRNRIGLSLKELLKKHVSADTIEKL